MEVVMKFKERNDTMGRLFLFGGLLTAKIIPYILHIGILLLTKRSLSVFTYELCNMIGLLCGLVLIYFAVGNMGFTKWKDYISCLSAIGLSMTIMNFGENILIPYISSYTYNVPWIVIIMYIVLVIIVVFFMVLGFMNGLRKTIPMIIVMAICIGFSIGYLLLQLILEKCIVYIKASFSATSIKP